MSARTQREWQEAAEDACTDSADEATTPAEAICRLVEVVAQLGALLAERSPAPERLTDAQLDGLTDEELAAALERAGGLPEPPQEQEWDVAADLRARAHLLRDDPGDFGNGRRSAFEESAGLVDLWLRGQVPAAKGAAWDLVAALHHRADQFAAVAAVAGTEPEDFQGCVAGVIASAYRDAAAYAREWLAGAPEPKR